jgi:hypothetical protein
VERATLAADLGRGLSDLSNTVAAISVKSGTQLKAERLKSAPVTSLPGVNLESGGSLSALNVKTVADLAAETPEHVAAAFGGDLAHATNVIKEAVAMGSFG